jgi:signal transduction histidine kinase
VPHPARVGASFILLAVAAGATVWAVQRSTVLARPESTGALRGLIVLTLAAAGAFTWWRRPRSRFGPLVLGLAAVYAVGTLNAFATPAVYTIGRVAVALFVVYFLYLALSFPYGDIHDRIVATAFRVIAVALILLWTAELLFGHDLARGYMLTDCAARCPHNPYAVIGDSALDEPLSAATRAATVAGAITVAFLMIRESRQRTQWIRRGYAALFLSLIGVLGALVAYVIWQPGHGDEPWALVVFAAIASLSVPVAVVVGQLRAHVISAWSLRSLLRDTGGGAFGLAEFQDRVRTALGDPTLTLTLLDPAPGEEVVAHIQVTDKRRITRPLTFDGHQLGSITYDARIDDVSGLAQAFGLASLLGYSHRALLEQLHETRHVAQTAIAEREQLERDLHDGAVQRVASLQLGLARLKGEESSSRLIDELELLEQHTRLLGAELRSLAHGIYPPALVERGVTAALVEATLASSDRVEISGSIPRVPGHIEHALYFSTLQAIQNALHHGGAWARARVELALANDTVVVRVSDDGVGFDPDEVIDDERHIGVASMRERTTTVGGTLAVRSAPGRGTSVTIAVPLTSDIR